MWSSLPAGLLTLFSSRTASPPGSNSHCGRQATPNVAVHKPSGTDRLETSSCPEGCRRVPKAAGLSRGLPTCTESGRHVPRAADVCRRILNDTVATSAKQISDNNRRVGLSSAVQAIHIAESLRRPGHRIAGLLMCSCHRR